MNCFYHPSVPAIGTCKHCCKGLCADCLTDLGHGLACRGKHEQEIEDTQAMFNDTRRLQEKASERLEQATRFQETGRFYRYMLPLFWGLLGLACLYPVIFTKEPSSTFQILLGLVCLLWGLVQVLNAVKQSR